MPILGHLQGQAGQGSQQPDQAVGVHVHFRVVGLDDQKGPFQLKPVYDSMIYRAFLFPPAGMELFHCSSRSGNDPAVIVPLVSPLNLVLLTQLLSLLTSWNSSPSL